MSKKWKPILCLDFDGVIHSYTSGWKGARNIPDDPVPGALGFIKARTLDYDVQIFSARSNQWGGRKAMKKWLFHHFAVYFGEDPDPRADEHQGYPTQVENMMRQIKFPRKKPPAHIGIDDRVLTFDGTWPSMETLKNFKPWNKK